jgi:hypothetical protein
MTKIYLTEDGRKEFESKIVNIENEWRGKVGYNMVLYQIETLKELLESAIVLPVKNDWDRATDDVWGSGSWEQCYPNGVIIEKPTK